MPHNDFRSYSRGHLGSASTASRLCIFSVSLEHDVAVGSFTVPCWAGEVPKRRVNLSSGNSQSLAVVLFWQLRGVSDTASKAPPSFYSLLTVQLRQIWTCQTSQCFYTLSVEHDTSLFHKNTPHTEAYTH